MSKEENLLELMKLRILRSFRWENDVVIPLSKELNIEKEELENILMGHLDMSSLENLHSTFESVKHSCLMDKLNFDLNLSWLSDILEIVSEEDKNEIKLDVIKEISNGKKYEDALNEGKIALVSLLNETKIFEDI
ncbi:DUF1959 family protein [Methanobrevibacter curvatus]|uniref:NiFe hydrogenase n=1 Tax=Methanobrevibacter curvatus TaxID=49547 RepID=A0A162FG79_9EURY|nr:DUF1959 family protein [Methanobrevibacter curvatus]KZX12595.1 hypothetical protein MBCUR_10060 [Methanobrevibacter curvatus]